MKCAHCTSEYLRELKPLDSMVGLLDAIINPVQWFKTGKGVIEGVKAFNNDARQGTFLICKTCQKVNLQCGVCNYMIKIEEDNMMLLELQTYSCPNCGSEVEGFSKI